MEFLSRSDCQELRDAGYPQGTSFLVIHPSGRVTPVPNENNLTPGYFACPTIEELIAEMGNQFRSLYRIGERPWSARSVDSIEGLPMVQSEGKTPLSAVKALWLELKGKQVSDGRV